METIRILNNNPDNTNDTTIIQRKGRTVFRLQRSENSLVELNETIPWITNDDTDGQYRQEIHPTNENYGDYDELDGRQFYPPIIPPPIFPSPPIYPFPPGFVYEYEFIEYQWCRPLAIEISICELCIRVPNICPII
ncbi:hypothetical protein BLA29_009648 [Euroglyphus maynei]|uniref:Uncharacterized protein n=1 Tax=Euroglyphus maynei TaxID=6958 RepID=A0A1Y3B013_EURMA|nr:hypothetical protein BLA29_009648 [Euroglyphus maynei]